MRAIIRHSLLNIGAFGLNAASQLAIVPLVVTGYGVAALGALALVRLLLPAGLLGLLVPGLQSAAIRLSARIVGEAATTATAKDLAVITRALQLTLLVSLVAGMIVCVLLLAFGPAALSGLVDAPPEETGNLVDLLPALAASMPLLFLGVAAQGFLTGVSRFPFLRLLDVTATVGFLILLAVTVVLEIDFQWVLAGFLLLQTGKALLFTFAAIRHLRRLARPNGSHTSGATALLRRELRTLAPSSLVGGGTTYLPPLMVLWIGGAPLLGLFDALRRIPMAIKQLNGMVRTTVLPTAVATADSPRYRRALAERGSYIVGLSVAPLTLHLGIFAAPLLTTWLGPAYAAHALVFLLFMLEIAVQEMQGVLLSAGYGHLRLVRRETLLRACQLALLLGGLALLLRPDDLVPAAVLMLSLTVLAAIVLAALFLPHFRLPARTWVFSQLRLLTISAAIAVLALWASADLPAALRLLVALPAGVALSMALCALVARGEERVALRQFLEELRGLLRRRREPRDPDERPAGSA